MKMSEMGVSQGMSKDHQEFMVEQLRGVPKLKNKPA
jgi:hypothetical protein